MSSNIHPQSAADSPVPANRAARRGQRKGKAASATTGKHRQVQQSQLMAQPRFKGRRGNR